MKKKFAIAMRVNGTEYFTYKRIEGCSLEKINYNNMIED